MNALTCKDRARCLKEAETLRAQHPYFRWPEINALVGWLRHGGNCVNCNKGGRYIGGPHLTEQQHLAIIERCMLKIDKLRLEKQESMQAALACWMDTVSTS